MGEMKFLRKPAFCACQHGKDSPPLTVELMGRMTEYNITSEFVPGAEDKIATEIFLRIPAPLAKITCSGCGYAFVLANVKVTADR